MTLSSESSHSVRNPEHITAWLLLSPALLLLGLFVLWPLGYLLFLSFTTGSFTRTGWQWYGLHNYLRLVDDPDFWQVLGNSLYFVVATVIPSLVIPFGLAVALNQTLVWRGGLRTLFFLPSLMSMVAAGLGFRWLFQNQGPLNQLMDQLGLAPIPWLSSPVWAMPVVILLSIWKQLGFNLVIFLAGLQAIPNAFYEAAKLDGAGPWQRLWYITLPIMGPTLWLATITTVLFTLRSFEQIYVTTGGGPLNSTNILAYYIYEQAFGQFDLGYAAAATLWLLLVTLILVYAQLRMAQVD
jgi:multiple sugar transport system permease protein